MNDEHEFESELRRLKPAPLPDELQRRLEFCSAAKPREAPVRRVRVWELFVTSLRWLAPASVAILLLVSLLWHGHRERERARTVAAIPAFNADHVEIERELIDSFETVASTSDGEPVRFRIEQWMEAVTLRDTARDVEVVRRTPRIEVVPVSFGSY